MTRIATVAVGLFVLWGLAAPAGAQDTWWIVPAPGDWSMPGNWTLGEPTLAINARINDGTAQITGMVDMMPEDCLNLFMGETGPLPGNNARIDMIGGAPVCMLTTHDTAYIGYETAFLGTFNQLTGSHSVGNELYLGYMPGSAGQYILQDGSLSVYVNAYVGHDGDGLFNQNGGTCDVFGDLLVGVGPSGTGGGIYDLLYGVLDVQGSLVLGSGFGQGASLNYVGGTLNVNTEILINAEGAMNVGMAWTCTTPTVTIDGGVLNSGTNALTFSGSAVTVGSTVLAGDLQLNGADLTQNDGNVLVDGQVYVNGGSYLLEGGSVDAEFIYNDGTFVQNGGFVGDLQPVLMIENDGQWVQAGGVCNVQYVENYAGAYTGDPLGQPSGPGVFIEGGQMAAEWLSNYGDYYQNGGTVDVSDTYDNWGYVEQSGGVLNATIFNNHYEYYLPRGVGDGPVGQDGGVYITGSAAFSAAMVNNGAWFEQDGGSVDVTTVGGDGEFNNYDDVLLSGGTFTVDNFNNKPGDYYNVPSLYVSDTADMMAGIITNNGWVEQYGGYITADVVINEYGEMLYGDLGALGAAGYQQAGIYITEDADFGVDLVQNRGTVWQDGGVVSNKVGGMGTFINYDEGSFYLGSGPYEMYGAGGAGGGAGQGGGTFNDHLINYGYFQYDGGEFLGIYEHRTGTGGFYHSADFTADGGIINWGQMENQEWLNIAANGLGLHNYGYFYMHAGELGGTGVVNEALGVLYTDTHVTITTSLTNYGRVGTDDVLTVTGPTDNYGIIELYEMNHFKPEGGLNNYGVLSCSYGGVVSGTGTVENTDGGMIYMYGNGAITAPLINSGVLECDSGMNFLLENLIENSGVIAVYCNGGYEGTPFSKLTVVNPFVNSGVILLEDDSMIGGGDITNLGTITGSCTVGNTVDNQGVLRPVAEEESDEMPYYYGAEGPLGTVMYGELVFTGAGCTSTGRIEAPVDTVVIFTKGLAANDGIIALTGGAFDNNACDMTNNGQIMGHGTFRAGTLTNDGEVRTADAATDVMAVVVNNDYVEVIENTTTFFGDVTNNIGATIKNTDGTVRMLGTFTNNGAMISDPADNYFMDIQTGGTGYFVGGLGDRFIVSGDFDSASTQNAAWSTANAELSFQRGADNQHTLGITGADLGKVAAGWVNNFAWGALRIEAGQKVELTDGNAAPGGALYLDTIDFVGVGSYIKKNELNVYYLMGGAPKKLYYGDATLDGMVNYLDLGILATNYNKANMKWSQGDSTGDGLVNYLDVGILATNYNAGVGGGGDTEVPEPATLAVLALGGLALIRRRRS